MDAEREMQRRGRAGAGAELAKCVLGGVWPHTLRQLFLRTLPRTSSRATCAVPSPTSNSLVLLSTSYSSRPLSAPPSVDPYLIMDTVRIPVHVKPPFCAHPHTGALIISILMEGQDMVSVLGLVPATDLPFARAVCYC